MPWLKIAGNALIAWIREKEYAMKELKPCPFCGEKLVGQKDLFAGGTSWNCPNNCIEKMKQPMLEEEFCKHWNTRPIEDTLCPSRIGREGEEGMSNTQEEIIVWHKYQDEDPGKYLVEYLVTTKTGKIKVAFLDVGETSQEELELVFLDQDGLVLHVSAWAELPEGWKEL